jgi:hypothetical protein
LPAAALVAVCAVLAVGCTEVDVSAGNASGTATAAAETSPESISEGTRLGRTAGSDSVSSSGASLVLDRATSACRDGDFKAFFDLFVRADTVRQVFTAPTVVVTRYWTDGRPPERSETPGDAFRSFPIRVEDVYWRPAASVTEASEDEYLLLEFDESQGEVFAVSWTRVRYDGQTEGGDDLGDALLPDGTPLQMVSLPDGKLVFRPFEDCWRLVADERFDRLPNN